METKKTFVFSDFFYPRIGLRFSDNSKMQKIIDTYRTPKKYKNAKKLKSLFDLSKSINDYQIIQMLGGEERVRKGVVTMYQVAQLIGNQWEGVEGKMLNNGCANIFYVLDKNGQLFAISVFWISGHNVWSVNVYEISSLGLWHVGDRVFLN